MSLNSQIRTLALPKGMEHWSLAMLREKLVKIGAKVVLHGRYVTSQLAEIAMGMKHIWEFSGKLTPKLTLCLNWRRTTLVKFGR